MLDLNKLVGGLSTMLQRLLGEDVDLRLVLPSDVGRVNADPGQIEQVLMNLAVNSRDAMAKGGILTIETANVELGGELRQAAYRAAAGIVHYAGGERHRQRDG